MICHPRQLAGKQVLLEWLTRRPAPAAVMGVAGPWRAWRWHALESLADRLDTLALILAGPVLRQVTPKSVTVWVALGEKADVTLSVLATDAPAGQTPLATATRTTVAIGRHLHIVAVTARTASALTEGKIYFYDLRFAGAFGSSTLTRAMTRAAQLGDASRIAYGSFKLPSFVLPPRD